MHEGAMDIETTQLDKSAEQHIEIRTRSHTGTVQSYVDIYLLDTFYITRQRSTSVIKILSIVDFGKDLTLHILEIVICILILLFSHFDYDILGE